MKNWRRMLTPAAVLLGITFSIAATYSGPILAPKPDPERVVRDRVRLLKVGEPETYGGLTVFPVTGSSIGGLSYRTLDEAIDKDLISVREKGSGEVNTVVITNKSSRRVFIMDGEEIIGAKQNRIVNSSVMIGPRDTVYMPVSCVEHGRWVGSSSEFKSGGITLPSSTRLQNTAAVSKNYELSPKAGPQSDQGMIWGEAARQRARASLSDGSGPLHEAYTAQKVHIEPFLKKFDVRPNQVGAVFAIRGRIVGADIFDQHRTLKELLPKLIQSYAIDAVSQDTWKGGKTRVPDRDDALDFIRNLLGSGVSIRDYDSPGEGRDVRITGRRLTGAGLVVSSRAVHISLFSRDDGPIIMKESGGIASPSQRMNHTR